jgi:PhzF family phenazine biosynthesis protein
VIEVVHTTVFSAGPGGGNPCPVVLDAGGLDTEQMQAFAARFGHETGFVVDDAPTLRFFVPAHEMSMCVHATVACVALLLDAGRLSGERFTVHAPIGELRADALAPTWISVDQRVPVRGETNPSASDVAAVIGGEVIGPPESWSASRPKLIVPVADVDALAPSFEALWELCDACGTTGIYAVDAGLNARQFPVRAGYPEDAATGVAAAALGGYLGAHTPPAAPGTVRYEIAQGAAMGRPSRLTTVIDWDGRAVTRVRVEGDVEILGREHV